MTAALPVIAVGDPATDRPEWLADHPVVTVIDRTAVGGVRTVDALDVYERLAERDEGSLVLWVHLDAPVDRSIIDDLVMTHASSSTGLVALGTSPGRARTISPVCFLATIEVLEEMLVRNRLHDRWVDAIVPGERAVVVPGLDPTWWDGPALADAEIEIQWGGPDPAAGRGARYLVDLEPGESLSLGPRSRRQLAEFPAEPIWSVDVITDLDHRRRHLVEPRLSGPIEASEGNRVAPARLVDAVVRRVDVPLGRALEA